MHRLAFFTVAFVALGSVASCSDPYAYWGGGPSEIVFGVQQSAAGIEADYDVIGLGGRGGSGAIAFRDKDGRGRCWYERLDARLGHSHFENGVARWSGGRLDGLTVLANQPETVKRPGPGWTSADTLTFFAEGFAMPPLDTVTMRAPVVELAVGDIAPAPDATTGALALAATTEVSVKWTPPEEKTESRVMVALTTARAEVRCFDDIETGSAVIGADWTRKLVDADAGSVGGKLTIASHRQTTLLANGGWIVYVVASHVHRDIAFTMR